MIPDTISYSKLDCWLKCGERFRRRYIENERLPPGITARRGSAAHKAFELNHNQKVSSGADLPLDTLTDACRDEYVHLLKNEGIFIPPEERPNAQKLMQNGLLEALNAVDLYHAQVAPHVQPCTVERYLEADVGIGVPLVGRWDLEDQDGLIRDFKVGKRRSQDWADTDLQPTFYTLLKYQADGQWPAGFRFDILVSNGKAEYLPLDTARERTHTEILMRYLRSFLRDMEAGVFRPADPSHWVCSRKWCEFHGTCPYVGNRLPGNQI